MKKLLQCALAAVLTVSLSAPVWASSHHKTQTVSYTVCTIKSCMQTGTHKHNNKTRLAHYNGDGHDYHDYCADAQCTLTDYHEHDGTYCFGHNINDGHTYHHANGGHH